MVNPGPSFELSAWTLGVSGISGRWPVDPALESNGKSSYRITGWASSFLLGTWSALAATISFVPLSLRIGAPLGGARARSESSIATAIEFIISSSLCRTADRTGPRAAFVLGPVCMGDSCRTCAFPSIDAKSLDSTVSWSVSFSDFNRRRSFSNSSTFAKCRLSLSLPPLPLLLLQTWV